SAWSRYRSRSSRTSSGVVVRSPHESADFSGFLKGWTEAGGLVLPGRQKRLQMRVARRPDASYQGKGASCFDPGRGEAAREPQHGQRRIQALLDDGDRLADPPG